MARLLAHWVLSALCLLVVDRFVPGITVRGFGTALVAALIIGFVNGTICLILKIVSFPLIVLTFGLFWFVINALMLKLASLVVPGFHVAGFAPAFWGAIILSLLNIAVRQLLRRSPA